MNRRRRPAEYAKLLAVHVKIAENTPLGAEDLAFVARLIEQLEADIDVRERFWETVKGRQAGKDDERHEYAVLDVAIGVERGDLLIDAKTEASGKWKLSEGQMDHAWRDYKDRIASTYASEGLKLSRFKALQDLRFAKLNSGNSQGEI